MVPTYNRYSVQLPDPKLDTLLRTAIRRRKLLRLHYKDRDRIVEPHDYGILDGSIKLLTFQIRGSSSGPLPSWRMMFVAGISNASMLDETFPGGRPPPSGKHYQWEALFARVRPAVKKSSIP